MWRKLWQLDEHQVKAVDYPVGILLMDQTIIMVVIIQLGLENLIQQIQGIDRLQKLIIFSLIQLTHIRLGSVEQDTVLELFRPDHLHLHDKLPTLVIPATHVHDTVLTQWVLGHQLRREVLNTFNLLAHLQGQQGVQKTPRQVGMLTKYLLKRQIRFWIQISFHSYFVNMLSTNYKGNHFMADSQQSLT